MRFFYIRDSQLLPREKPEIKKHLNARVARRGTRLVEMGGMKLQFQAHQPGNSAIRTNRTVEPNQSTEYKSAFKRKNLFFEIFGDYSGKSCPKMSYDVLAKYLGICYHDNRGVSRIRPSLHRRFCVFSCIVIFTAAPDFLSGAALSCIKNVPEARQPRDVLRFIQFGSSIRS